MRRTGLLVAMACAIVATAAWAGCDKRCTCIFGEASPRVALESQSSPALTAGFPNPCEIDLDFGTLPVGQGASAVVEIENVGIAQLDLSFDQADLDAAFELSKEPPTAIEPGSFYSFSVAFGPTAAGPASSTFAIQTDGMNEECPAPDSGDAGASIKVVLAGTGSPSE